MGIVLNLDKHKKATAKRGKSKFHLYYDKQPRKSVKEVSGCKTLTLVSNAYTSWGSHKVVRILGKALKKNCVLSVGRDLKGWAFADVDVKEIENAVTKIGKKIAPNWVFSIKKSNVIGIKLSKYALEHIGDDSDSEEDDDDDEDEDDSDDGSDNDSDSADDNSEEDVTDKKNKKRAIVVDSEDDQPTAKKAKKEKETKKAKRAQMVQATNKVEQNLLDALAEARAEIAVLKEKRAGEADAKVAEKLVATKPNVAAPAASKPAAAARPQRPKRK